VWPGGGITFMVDVTRTPPGSFGYVPTPALVAPLEFTMPAERYLALGGHRDSVTPMTDAMADMQGRLVRADQRNPWPTDPVARS